MAMSLPSTRIDPASTLYSRSSSLSSVDCDARVRHQEGTALAISGQRHAAHDSHFLRQIDEKKLPS